MQQSNTVVSFDIVSIISRDTDIVARDTGMIQLVWQ